MTCGGDWSSDVWSSDRGGGGDVRGGAGERDDHGWEPDDERERGGDGGELDAEPDRGAEHPDGLIGDVVRQPGHVHGDRLGGARGYDGEELGGQSHLAGGHPPT